MNYHLIIMIFFILTTFSSLVIAKQEMPTSSKSILLGSGEWPPYEGFKLPEYGLSNYWVRKAFESEGISIEFHFLPWKKSMAYASDGRFHGTLVWTKTPEREESFYFSSPILKQKTVFFHSSHKKLSWKSLSDLKGLRIGITKGYVYHPDLDRLIKEDLNKTPGSKSLFFSSVNENPGDEMSLRQLVSNKIDIWPVEIPVAQSLIRKFLTKQQTELITWNPRPLNENTYHLILNRKNTENLKYLEAFERGFNRLKKHHGEKIITEPCNSDQNPKNSLSKAETEIYQQLCP